MKRKAKGATFVSTIAAVVAWMILSVGIFLSTASQFRAFTSADESNEARMYAMLDSHLLHLVNFDNITNAGALYNAGLHLGRAGILHANAPEWEDELKLSNVKYGADEVKYRIATINIYKVGEASPRASVDVPISSKSSYYSQAEVEEILSHYYKKSEVDSMVNDLKSRAQSYSSEIDGLKECKCSSTSTSP